MTACLSFRVWHNITLDGVLVTMVTVSHNRVIPWFKISLLRGMFFHFSFSFEFCASITALQFNTLLNLNYTVLYDIGPLIIHPVQYCTITRILYTFWYVVCCALRSKYAFDSVFISITEDYSYMIVLYINRNKIDITW